MELGLCADHACHDGRFRLYSEIQEILHMAVGNVDIQFDGVTSTFDIDHSTARGEAGVSQSCIHGLKISIAASTVYNRVKPGMQRDGVVSSIQGEVGCLCCSVHFDF